MTSGSGDVAMAGVRPASSEAGGDNGIVPISSGNNTCSFVNSKGKLVTVHGFAANGSYNDATGWGTVTAAQFVPASTRPSTRSPLA